MSTAGGLALRSSGVIYDPYKYVPPNEATTFSQGITARIDGAKSVLKSSYSSAFIQRHLKGFNHRTFPELAGGVFTKFMDAYRLGDVAALRSVVTEGLLEGIKQELKAQQAAEPPPSKRKKHTQQGRGGGGKQPGPADPLPRAAVRTAFVVQDFLKDAAVLQMRHGFSVGKARSANTGFGQVTVLVHSRREVVSVDSKGQILMVANAAGKEEVASSGVVEVPSLLVLEVGFGDLKENWRIARIEELGSRGDGPKK
jgi:hypothetical protein